MTPSTRAILFLLMVTFSLTACKKSDSNESSDSYVKVKREGNWITYKGLGELNSGSSQTTLVISGSNNEATEVLNIAITANGSSVSPGSYVISEATHPYLVISYSFVVGGSSLKVYHASDAPSMAPSSFTVNITSITDTEVQGNFTGNYVYEDSGSGGDVIGLTEGEFKVKRIQ